MKPLPSEEVVAAGLEAAKPFIKVLCDAQPSWQPRFPKQIAEFPVFVDYADDVYAAVEETATVELSEVISIADKQTRGSKPPIPSRARLSSVWRRSSRAARRSAGNAAELSPRSWFGSGS